MNTKTAFFLSFIFFTILTLTIPQAFAEGGGGVDCPQSVDVYTYIGGSAIYKVTPFEEGQLGVLFCEYETESEDPEIEPFGEINAVFHISGELNQELIDEYGCGAILGVQYSSTYVSSTTHFASVAFSNTPLIEAASNIMSQIEDQNIASICDLSIEEIANQESIAEQVQESIEEHEVIEDTSIEIENEQINEETIEIIKEQIEEGIAPKKSLDIDLKPFAVVLPNWIKNNAGWWSSDQITNDDFSLGIAFMINEGFIKVPITEVSAQTSSEIPDWVKNNAGWWADGQISDDDFVNGLQFLISNGIIQVSKS